MGRGFGLNLFRPGVNPREVEHLSKVEDIVLTHGTFYESAFPLDGPTLVVCFRGLDLKIDSPFEQTMIAELANGSIGYIPNRRAYPQGNYEVVSARCAAGSGEKLVGTAVSLLKQVHAEVLAAK